MQHSMTGSKEEATPHKRRSKSETASQQAATRKRNFLKLLSIKRSKDTPLRPKPNLRFPKVAWREGGRYGDPADTYPPLGRLEPSIAAGAKEWPVSYLGTIPNCSDWRAYGSRSEFMQHVDWAKRHGYVMWRSLSQKLLLLSNTWMQVTDKRKKLLYILNGIAQISSISSCEDAIDEDLVLGIKCLHPLGSMVQCHVLIVQSRKAMAEICLELEGCFESLARDRGKVAEQVQSVSESLARIQHQGGKAFTVHHLADGALEGVELESRYANSEQPPVRDHTLGMFSAPMEDSRVVSVASSTAGGSLHPPIPTRQFEIRQLDPTQTGVQVPKRLQTLVQSQPPREEVIIPQPDLDADSDKASLEPIPPSPSTPPEPADPFPDKPVARRIKNLISKLDLSEEQPAATHEGKPQPPPPKKIWQDGEEDEPSPPVIMRPRRRQLDDPVPAQQRPGRPSNKQDRPPNVQKFHQTVIEVKDEPLPPLPIMQAPKSTSYILAETERELRNQQLELDLALKELEALNLGVELPITHVDDVERLPTQKQNNPITSADKRQMKKSNKKEFSVLRNLIPPPPPDIPPELLDSSESFISSEAEADAARWGEVEVLEQATAKELRRKFDPHPDRKTALIYEINLGKNLRKVSGDHPDQRPKQNCTDFRSVLTEIKQGGSKQRLRKVSQASLNRLAQSQKGRTVGELGAKLAERRLASEPPEHVPVDPAAYKAQLERHASRFARNNTVVNPQTDLDAEPAEYLPPWKRQLLESREQKRVAAIRDKEETERLREEQMRDIPIWKRKLIERKAAERETETKKEDKDRARVESRIRKFENLPEWKKELLRKQGKVDVIETSGSDTESD